METMEDRHDGNTAAAAAVSSKQEGLRELPPNPIAALIRRGAEEAGRVQGSSRATTKVQRMINSLQWRQAHSKDDIYPLAMESGAVLEIRQLKSGEMTGLGTGATVWPAAHVLAKYLERRFGEEGMEGLRVVDLGSGTGVAGIVAASLGAEAFLTDQEQLLFLMRENAERSARDSRRDTSETTPRAASHTRGAIHVLTYDWGMEDDALSPPVDVVLVSDCVLPKLYPIEPLVDAIDRLSGPETVTIMSYEHRHYEAFDPRRRFEELAAARGLVKVEVPQAQQHPIFSADDIEIWNVRRRRGDVSLTAAAATPGTSTASATGGTELATGTVDAVEDGVALFFQSQASPLEEPVEMAAVAGTGLAAAAAAAAAAADMRVVVSMFGEMHELAQTPSGTIGCYLWPSGVVMARHLVDANAGGGGHSGASGTPPLYPPRASVLELGSGVGLVAMTASLLGWNVVGTDKADALPLLEANVKRCLSSTKRACVGTVDVVEYDWGTDAGKFLTGRRDAGNATGYDLVICADCVYARASVEPLLASLCQVCDEHTIVLVTNELRSAFDEFLQGARGHFEVEDLHVPENQMVIDPTSNQRPKPVALKRMRRRLSVTGFEN